MNPDLTPDQWRQVKEIFGAALERSAADRPAFLAQACADSDEDVRREVLALLAAHETADSFLERPPARGTALGTEAPLLGEGETLGHYRVLGRLGAGGMGAVYLAEDLRLRRRVALKLLTPRAVGSADRLERFEQEARVASGLSHPNVSVIYEVGEEGDRNFIAMEYIPGRSLRQVLDDHREAGTPLPLAQALDLAWQAASGLAAAHEAGIVHRDVKPENVMVRPDGLVKVLDFGLATSGELRPGMTADGAFSVVTEPGMVMGTARYMSPEQARGLPVDGRTDVWSLGAVIYEMLAGEPPFRGDTPSDVMAAVLSRDPEPLAGREWPLPPDLPRIVTRALSKDRDARYQRMSELAADLEQARRTLTSDSMSGDHDVRAPPVPAGRSGPPSVTWPRRVILGMLLVDAVIVLGATGYWGWWRSGGTHASDDVSTTAPMGGAVRVAVLPFENLSRPQDAYLVDGISDEIRGKLSALRGLEVVARTSSVQYRGSSKTPGEVAQELGARYLLTATVRWERGSDGDPGRLRVSPELDEIVAGTPVTRWQQPFDAAAGNIFEVQAELARQVAAELQVVLGAHEKEELAERPTANLAAYDAFLKGEATEGLVIADAPRLRDAMTHYEEAVALDPAFALAWAQLARAHATFYSVITPTPASAEAARRASARAVLLAPDRAESRFAVGDYYAYVLADNVRALAAYRAGVRASPGNADLLSALALADESLGRWKASLTPLRRAQLLDPRSVLATRRLAVALLRLRRYPEALAATDRGLAIAPGNLDILASRAMIYLAQGDLAAAQAVLRVVPPGVSLPELVAFMGNYADLGWALDDAQQQLLLRLGPGAFGDDRATWGIVLAETAHLRDDSALTHAYADSARAAAEEQIRGSPRDALRHVLLGLAHAYLGRKTEATAEGRRAVALSPVSRDAYLGPYVEHQLARIYILTGEPDKALDLLEDLLRMPYYLSPAWLRVDPTFAPLSANPRFRRLTQDPRAGPAERP